MPVDLSKFKKKRKRCIYVSGLSLRIAEKYGIKSLDGSGSFIDNKRYREFENISEKIEECGTFLAFDKENSNLKYANFCRMRMCPMCMWRRSLKIYANLCKIKEKLGDNYYFVMYTLTQRNNINIDEMNFTIKKMNVALRNIWERYRGNELGWLRSLEVTINCNKSSEWYKSFHPHYHLLCVLKKGDLPKSTDELKKIWQHLMKLDYIPECKTSYCDEVVSSGVDRAILEIGKYCTKPKSFMTYNLDFDLYAFENLYYGLKGKRLLALRGILKEYGSLLHDDLDGIEKKDLYHDFINDDKYLCYVFNHGLLDYLEI